MTDEDESFDDDFDATDLGEPIAELRELVEDPPTGFIGRLLNSLRRRDLSSQLVSFSWNGLGTVLFEFIQMIFSIFDTNPRDRGDQG